MRPRLTSSSLSDYSALIIIAIAGASVGEILASRTDAASTGVESPATIVARVAAWALVAVPFAIVTRRVLTSEQPRERRAVVLSLTTLAMVAAHALLVVAVASQRVSDVRTLLRGDALVGVLVALTVYGLEYERVVRRARAHASEQQTLATQAQLQMLRMQLNPHFLFNSLNAVSALIDTEPRSAQRMIDQLGGFLRQTLSQAPHGEVTLANELALVRQYLEIERIRFGGRLRVEMDVADDVGQVTVPSLLLQPIVENAVRHGIQPSLTGGTLSIRARAEEKTLRIDVEDDGVGMSDVVRSTPPGIGISNTRDRLRHSYGSAASLRLAPRTDGGTVATITLPLARRLAESIA